MIPLLADIGPDSIPGTVALPTWVLVAAVVFLVGVIVKLIAIIIKQGETLATRLAENTAAMEKVAKVLE